jgi:hypothetical protein
MNPWDGFVRCFVEGYFEQFPTFGATVGCHRFDGRLPDWSPEGNEDRAAWLRARRREAQGFTGLDHRRTLERDHLLAQIDTDLFWQVEAGWPWSNPIFYSGSLDPSLYLTRNYAPLEQRMRAYVDYARAIPRAAEQIRANLRTPMPRSFAHLGLQTLGGLADYFESDVPPIFAKVEDPALHEDFRKANAAAASAMRGLGAWFKAVEEEAPRYGFALGADRFQKMLRQTERVDVPLAELEAAGRRELDRNLAALQAACAELAPG